MLYSQNVQKFKLINIKMGQTKSGIVKAYNQEYLHYYIERNDIPSIQLLLQKRPQLIQATLTHKSKMTPLYRACFNGNLKMVQFFIQKCNADINRLTQIGQTALMAATKRNHLSIVRYLIAKGADVNIVAKVGLSTLQFAILPGFYQIALQLYQRVKNKELKPVQQFQEWAQLYTYRYVNYKVFIQFLQKQVELENVSDFLTKPKIVLKDPVADPRQTWKAWIKRQMQFKDPPLVERQELPEQLQPQNRKFGKLQSILSNMARSPLTQKSQYQPRHSSSAIAPHTQHEFKKTNPQITEELQTQTIS